MRFDLRGGPGSPVHPDRYRAALDMVAWSEDRGGALVVVSEHHAAPDGYLPAPLIFASALAARTRSIPILVAAALLPLYDPVRLAEEMAVLDHVSAGRVSYVLGLGYRPEEYESYGVPMAQRGAIADDKLELLLRIRGGEPVIHRGRRIHVTPAPATPGGPPIAWGGGTPAAARRAARFGLDFLAQTDGAELRDAYVEEAHRIGNAPGTCTLPDPRDPLTVFVADDVDAAWDELGPYLLHDAVSYAAWNDPNTRTASISRGRTTAELRAEHGAHRILTVAEAVEHVRARGVLPLQPLCGGLPPEAAWPYLERVADAVVPATSG